MDYVVADIATNKLNWSPGGAQIILSYGKWGEQAIDQVNTLTGESRQLAKGSQPVVATLP